jgi:hypothetical protein
VKKIKKFMKKQMAKKQRTNISQRNFSGEVKEENMRFYTQRNLSALNAIFRLTCRSVATVAKQPTPPLQSN